MKVTRTGFRWYEVIHEGVTYQVIADNKIEALMMVFDEVFIWRDCFAK
jgi:hypothetical protein